MYNLPTELIKLIYEYDVEKREKFNKVISEFNELVEENTVNKIIHSSSSYNIDNPSHWYDKHNTGERRFYEKCQWLDYKLEDKFLDFIMELYNTNLWRPLRRLYKDYNSLYPKF